MPRPEIDCMDPDQEICLCFHVTRRKIESYLRIEKPKRAAQLADCFGAGTGCGWCRRYLTAMFEAAQQTEARTDPTLEVEIPDAQQYSRLRKEYHRSTGYQE
ncbi:MAG: (2Fe-2S)-binding protein [Pirellulaceae bacterium]